MMIQSMTGFASKTFALTGNLLENSFVTLQIKTLNSRFFETTIKTAPVFASLETKIVSFLKKSLKRGSITVTLYSDNKNLLKSNIKVDEATVKGYLDALKYVQETHAIPGTITIQDIMALPNIFTSNDTALDDAVEQQILNEASLLIATIVTAREHEGAVMQKDIQERIAVMHTEIGAVERRVTQLLIEQKEKINAALTQEASTIVDPVTDARKVVLHTTLDKMDVHEEIVRFNNHLKNLSTTLNDSTVEKGKRLDFILQELGREINTISAKCADSALSAHTVNIKVEVEKAREQVQNIV